MTPRLILTIDQARTIQQQSDDTFPQVWPEPYATLLLIPIPGTPDNLLDPERTTVGLDLIKRGWSDEQIALQLAWKVGKDAHGNVSSGTVKQLRRIHKIHTHCH